MFRDLGWTSGIQWLSRSRHSFGPCDRYSLESTPTKNTNQHGTAAVTSMMKERGAVPQSLGLTYRTGKELLPRVPETSLCWKWCSKTMTTGKTCVAKRLGIRAKKAPSSSDRKQTLLSSPSAGRHRCSCSQRLVLPEASQRPRQGFPSPN